MTSARGRRHPDAAVPVLPPVALTASQLALTLRAVGGLTTAQIAAAFLVPEATMAQRISRAKATINGAGGRSRCRRTPSSPIDYASSSMSSI